MLLLKWCTLEPSGPSSLAAIRFSSPVRIQAITIFPSNYQPFAQSPDIISRTEPEAFFLELHFNAHPVAQPNSKEKPRVTNALVPTLIAYPGGRMQFDVNMSSEFPTRLMIARGAFQSVSMAIYGDVVSEMPPPSLTYEPKAIPSFDPIPLSNALDPSNFRDPTRLALQLLELIPDAPPLSLIIRLMFCLKPSNDDWDLPEFPYLYADLDEDFSDLEKAFRLTSRPVADTTSHASFARFSEAVARSLGPKDDNQCYYFAGLLCHAACQNPDMATSILECTDPVKVFDSSLLDTSTLRELIDATANPDIAKALNTDEFLEILGEVESSVTADRQTRVLAQELIAHLDGMSVFEDAVSNTQGDFARAAATLKRICGQEQSFGIWLAVMVTHQDLLDKLSENPPSSVPLQHLPLLFKSTAVPASHDEFIAFLRALIGVSCVLAVYAWADSLPESHCRERTLGILRLWHGVDGYREILDHLLLLRQMIFRLECMLDNDVPTRAAIDAENILVNLTKTPKAFLQPELMRCVLSLKLPQCYITEDELDSMRAAAIVVDDGLLGAVDQLLQPVERPITLRNLRSVRVALAVVEQEIEDRGEREVMQEFWKEGSRGLETCLVDIFTALNDELAGYFSVHLPPPSSPELVAQLFRASDEALKLLMRLAPTYPLPGRVVRAVSASAADLFVFTDSADMLYSQTSPACIAAQETRQSCVDVQRLLADTQEALHGAKLPAEIVLRALLTHGLRSADHDPSHHLVQVFCLVDLLLPLPDGKNVFVWIHKVIPNVLRELWAFARSLDTENKAHLVRRLAGLDKGSVGIGDWLLEEELKELAETLKTVERPDLHPQYRIMRQYQASLSFRFLHDLIDSSSDISTWCAKCIRTSPGVAHKLSDCLQMCFEQAFSSAQLGKIVRSLAASDESIEEVLKLPLLLMLLRMAQYPGTSPSDLTSTFYLAHSLLLTMTRDSSLEESVASELGGIVNVLHDEPQFPEGAMADALLGVFEWLATSDGPNIALQGVTDAALEEVLYRMRTALNKDRRSVLESIQGRFVAAEKTVPYSPVFLPESIELTAQDVEDLLRVPTPAPSTPQRKVLNQDVLSLVAISPPTAVIRSSASTGLTKTYLNNDFRQLRQMPSARQNTSRLPSMHVDDFENVAASPTLLQQPLPLSAPMPFMGPPAMPFAAATTTDNIQAMSPLFKPL